MFSLVLEFLKLLNQAAKLLQVVCYYTRWLLDLVARFCSCLHHLLSTLVVKPIRKLTGFEPDQCPAQPALPLYHDQSEPINTNRNLTCPRSRAGPRTRHQSVDGHSVSSD